MRDKQRLIELDKKYLMHPMMNPRHYSRAEPKLVVSAQGVMLKDGDGREIIDGFSGLWCMTVGHNHPRIIEAVNKQMKELCFFSSFQGSTTPPSIELAARLAGMFDPDYKLTRTWFTCGGSESNESNIKIARLYNSLAGRPEKNKILSRRLSYHGMGLATTAATGILPFHDNIGPLPGGFINVASPYCYRCEFGKTWPDCGLECVKDIERTIKEEGPETVAAFIAEPVIGAGGVVPGPPEYFPRVRQICDKYDILLILDEVITGFGRTGKMFGHQHWEGVRPDMMSLAKGISSAHVPLGAAVINSDIYESIGENLDPQKPVMHGFTYMNHPVSCAAGLACIDVIEEEGLVEKAANNGKYLLDKLGTFKDFDCIGDVRGMGLMSVLDLEVYKEGQPENIGPQTLVELCWQKGLYVRSSTKTTVSIAPPMSITREEIDRLLDILDSAVRQLEKELK